jgi:hypothetical protein
MEEARNSGLEISCKEATWKTGRKMNGRITLQRIGEEECI